MFDWTWKVKFHFPPVLCSFQLKENTWLWFIWALSFLAKHKLAFLIEGMLTQIRTSFVQILQLLWWIFRETPLWFDWESPQLSMPKAWVLCHFCSHFTEWSYRLCWGSSSHRSQAIFLPAADTEQASCEMWFCTRAIPVGFCDYQQAVTSTCTFRQLRIPRAQFEETISEA